MLGHHLPAGLNPPSAGRCCVLLPLRLFRLHGGWRSKLVLQPENITPIWPASGIVTLALLAATPAAAYDGGHAGIAMART